MNIQIHQEYIEGEDPLQDIEELNRAANKQFNKSFATNSINSLMKSKKNSLESDYENIIQEFYLSDEFNKLKNDDKIKELNNNFIKIMKISLLDNNGFIQFYETRKGNNTKNRDN